MTQKEELEAAQAKVKDLETQLSTAKGEASANETKANGFKAQFDAEVTAHSATKSKLDGEEKAHGETKQKLSAAEKDRDEAKSKAQTAHDAAKENLAFKGIGPAAKENPAALAEGQKDGEAVLAEYEQLMKAGDAKGAAEYFAKNEKALNAHLTALDTKRRQG